MTSVAQTRDIGQMSEAIHSQLWECIDSRLERGDTLVRPVDFQRALEVDYAGITRQPVSRTVRRELANSVVTINRSRPERYVAAGVQNSARRAFELACAKLRWPSTQIQNSGPMVIARFKSHDRVRELLGEVGLRSNAIDAEACVDHALQVASGEREPLTDHDPTEPVPTALAHGPTVEPELSIMARPSAEAPGDASEEEETLSNEERRRGAIVGRFEMRVAGARAEWPASSCRPRTTRGSTCWPSATWTPESWSP